ncbi:MAG: response regulator [Chloroflexi bacterium]|nr:MAG: response regulator [Chloroflexota bacterium]TME17007.1 MAG: response regulator [Chloroflexota bacterium]TME19430.1 MAG: response regulator [Chloroflexota bacterium]
MIIIDDIPSTVDNLKKLLSFEKDIDVVGTALTAEAGIAEVRNLLPDVVLMDVNMPGQDGIQTTELLVAEPPHVPVVLMSVQDDREYLGRAMQAGAREFLVKPFSGDELVAALRRVNQLEKLKRQHLVPLVSEEAAAKDGGHSNGAAGRRAKGEIHLVYSGKGGVGKSMVAVNLAAALVTETGEKVALVDFDLQFGDLGVLLGLDSARNIYHAVENFHNIDGEYIDALMPEAPGGFKVLLGPQSPELADLVSTQHTRMILDILTESHAHVVVDTSSHLGEVVVDAIEHASHVILVIDLSLPAVKEAKLVLRVLERLKIAPERILLVVNRSDANSGITAAQVEASLDVPIKVQIPSDGKLMLKSLDRAEPFITLFPDADVSQRIRELASCLLPLQAAESARARSGKRAAFWSRSGPS